MRQDVNPKKDDELLTSGEWRRTENDAARVLLGYERDKEELGSALEPKEVREIIGAAMLNAAKLARIGFRDERPDSATRGRMGRE